MTDYALVDDDGAVVGVLIEAADTDACRACGAAPSTPDPDNVRFWSQWGVRLGAVIQHAEGCRVARERWPR